MSDDRNQVNANAAEIVKLKVALRMMYQNLEDIGLIETTAGENDCIAGRRPLDASWLPTGLVEGWGGALFIRGTKAKAKAKR